MAEEKVDFHPCPSCRQQGLYLHQWEEKDNSGCIIAILGAALAPLLIGIPIIIYGLANMTKRKRVWVCTGCGKRFPA